MNRRLLIEKLQRGGGVFVRHGGKHDYYRNPETGRVETIPRHREVDERLAKKILKSLTGT